MERKIYLIFTDYKEHLDLSFLDNKKVSIDRIGKGDIRPNGRTIQPYHSINIHLNQELPDDYDARIEALIAAIGGENILKELVSKYQARINAIVLGIPAKTGELIEDGYISCEIMQKLCDLGLDIQFYYT